MDSELTEITLSQLAARDLNKPDRPPLCIECEYIATSASQETVNHKCLCPNNYKGINLVDGFHVLVAKFCITQRESENVSLCGIVGNWFKKRIDKPLIVNQPTTTVTSIADRARNRLSKDKLDNL